MASLVIFILSKDSYLVVTGAFVDNSGDWRELIVRDVVDLVETSATDGGAVGCTGRVNCFSKVLELFLSKDHSH